MSDDCFCGCVAVVGSTGVEPRRRGDDEGNRAHAEVLGHDAARHVLWLRVSIGTFQGPSGNLGKPTLPDGR